MGLPARRAPTHACQCSPAGWAAGLSPRRGEAWAALCPGSSQVLCDASGDVQRRGEGGTGAARCSGARDMLVRPSGGRCRGDSAGLPFSSLLGKFEMFFFKSDGREHVIFGADLLEDEGDGKRLAYLFIYLCILFFLKQKHTSG